MNSRVNHFIAKWHWYLIFALLIAGFVMEFTAGLFPPKYVEIARSVGEAAIIAALLAIVVDPYLKVELVDDVARGMWQHLVGFDHEPAIKERLQKMAFETKIYRRDFRMNAKIIDLGDNRARLDLSLEYKVKNASPEAVEYQHKMSCDEFEYPEFFSMSMTSVDDPKVAKRAGKIQVDTGADAEPGVRYSCLKKVFLKPRIEYDCRTKCSVTFPRNHFFVLNTSYPTMGIRLEVDAPQGCNVFPSKTDHRDGNVWNYPQLFMTHEHISLRWKFDK